MLKILVLCPDERVVEELDLILSDRDDVAVRRAFTETPGQIELDRYLRFQSPGAILVSSGGDNHTMRLVEYVRHTYPNLPVVVLCPDADQGALSLLPFMRAGVREVIFKPLDRREVREVVDRLCAMPAKDAIPKAGKVLCFLPSKPGVGASTVAINTAAALAREGNKVLLVDGDLTSGMIRFLLKLQNPASIRDAARWVSDLDEFLWPKLVTTVREGLDVLHAGQVALSGSLDSEVLQNLTDFWRTAYDVVCFDFSGNLEQFSLDVMRYADRIFLVSTSEVTSLHLLREKLQLLKASDIIDRIQVIQNRKTHSEDLNKRQIEELIGVPVCKVFRNSYSETLAASRAGRAIRANSALGAEFKAFASELSGRPAPSGKLIGQIMAALAEKARAFRAPQPKVLGSGARQLVTFQPLLALPAPEPKEIVRYGS
jgi:Flp pilus assembly CpaE family ATPase